MAGFVMVRAMARIIKMFDGALGSTNQLTEIHATVACAQTAIEQIKPTPFYKPWSNSDQDIDDFFQYPGHVPCELRCPGHRYRRLSMV